MRYLITVSLLWAFSFGIIGSRLSGLDSIFVATTRLSLAWLCFIPFFRPHTLTRRGLLQLTAIGAFQFGLMYVCYMRAYAYLPSHLVALFSVLTPLYIVIGHDVSKKRFQWKLIACAGLSIAGAVIIKLTQPEGDFWIGFALMQIANIAFGIGQLLYRNWKLAHPETNDASVMAALYAGATALSGIAFAIWGNFDRIAPSLEQWLAILYLGVVASGFGFFLWNKGASQTSAAALAASNNAVVPLAMASSLFAFGEISAIDAPSLLKLVSGAALIGISIIWGRKLD